MSTAGSAYCCAPFAGKLTPNKVFPEPGPPATRVGLPCGSPPCVMSSSPGIPVGAFCNSERSNLLVVIARFDSCVVDVSRCRTRQRRVVTQDIDAGEIGGVSQGGEVL